jgi:hypothetical protein
LARLVERQQIIAFSGQPAEQVAPKRLARGPVKIPIGLVKYQGYHWENPPFTLLKLVLCRQISCSIKVIFS